MVFFLHILEYVVIITLKNCNIIEYILVKKKCYRVHNKHVCVNSFKKNICEPNNDEEKLMRFFKCMKFY